MVGVIHDTERRCVRLQPTIYSPPPPHPRPQLFFYYLMWVERSFSCTSEAFHWYNQIHTQDVNHACRHSNDSRDSFWWKSHVVLFWTWRDRDNDDSYSSQYTKRWNRSRFLSPSRPDFCSGCLVSQNESNLGLVPQVWQHPHQSFTCLSTACRMASVLINKVRLFSNFLKYGIHSGHFLHSNNTKCLSGTLKARPVYVSVLNRHLPKIGKSTSIYDLTSRPSGSPSKPVSLITSVDRHKNQRSRKIWYIRSPQQWMC